METALVTLFTPAYNVENYIEKCIKSIQAQSFRNYEWIIVENGSTDTTKNIIERYAQQDLRIKVIYHKENMDGFAQKYIIDYAVGKYIVKIDSDDWVDSQFLEKMIVKMQQENADLVCCNTSVFDQETGKNNPHEYSLLNDVFTKEDINNIYLDMRPYLMAYWAKIMKKELFEMTEKAMTDINIRLCSNSHFGGDTMFILVYLGYCNRIAFISDEMYHYRLHVHNATRVQMNVNRLENFLIIRELEEKFLQKSNAASVQNCTIYETFFWANIEMLLKSIIASENETIQKIKMIEQIYADERVVQIRVMFCNSKIRSIISTYATWCFLNLPKGAELHFEKILFLVDPKLFQNVSPKEYSFLVTEKILLSFLILGEYDNAAQYLQSLYEAGNLENIYFSKEFWEVLSKNEK